MIKIGEIIILTAASALFLGSWLSILFYFNPLNASLIIFILFYLSLFLFLTLFFTLLKIVFFKIKQSRKNLLAPQNQDNFVISFRHGILLAIILSGSLMLRGLKIWNWFSGGSIFLCVLILEIYFWRKEQSKQINYF